MRKVDVAKKSVTWRKAKIGGGCRSFQDGASLTVWRQLVFGKHLELRQASNRFVQPSHCEAVLNVTDLCGGASPYPKKSGIHPDCAAHIREATHSFSCKVPSSIE
jgi:hypothetical protein